MATLFRKKNRQGSELPNWYCSFQVPNRDGEPRQVHRSTGETTKREALAKAIQLEAEARDEAGADSETTKVILGKIREAGELAIKGRLNPAHARRLIGEILQASGEIALANFTLREWADEWLKEKVATTKPATVAFYRSTTKDFISFIGERADSHLETITSKDIREFRDEVVNRGRTAKTANHKLKGLRSMFGDAVKVSALLQNPASAVKQLSEDDSTTREPFSSSELSKLIKCSPSLDWEGIILLGAFAGLRLGDASTLKAGNLDLERGVVNLMPHKTSRKKTTVEIPLHPELISFFKNNPPSPFPATPIFPSLVKVTPGGRNGLSARFGAIMDKAKVSRQVSRRAADGAARDTSARSYHSLRHTFTSALAKADVPEEVRMKMTGHTESSTHQKYTHQEISTLRAGVDKIPSLK